MRPWHASERFLLAAYLVWIAIGLSVVPLHVTENAVAAWPLPGFLRAFVRGCLDWGDPVLILLAAANTHLMLAKLWGKRHARRWLLLVVALSALVETVGTMTGQPFGHYAYTWNFGPRIGLLPVAIPLAWFVLVSNALILWRSFLPGFIIAIEAAAAATLVTALDFLMEPFAWRIKAYWLWSEPAVPLRNYVSWWVVAFLLVHLFAKTPGHQDRWYREPRPLLILGTMAALFAVTRGVCGI